MNIPFQTWYQDKKWKKNNGKIFLIKIEWKNKNWRSRRINPIIQDGLPDVVFFCSKKDAPVLLVYVEEFNNSDKPQLKISTSGALGFTHFLSKSSLNRHRKRIKSDPTINESDDFKAATLTSFDDNVIVISEKY